MPKNVERSLGDFPKQFLILITVCFLVLILRLWALQVLEADYYRQRAERNYMREVSVPALRGRVFDAQGTLMADNLPSYEMIMNCRAISSSAKERNIEMLSGILGLPQEMLSERVQTRPADRFGDKILLRDMEFADVVAVAENLPSLSGVQIRSRPKRIYPLGHNACHVLGYIGEVSQRELTIHKEEEDYQPGDDIGKMGLERQYEKYLRGSKGIRRVQVSSKGLWEEDLREIKPNLPGGDLHLTLDAELQAFTDKLIESTPGAIVLLDPRNGGILAMSSSPTFDPNFFCGPIDPEAWRTLQSDETHPLQNRAIASMYPPGSVFKLILAWAGLNERIVNNQTSFSCTGVFHLGSWPFRCHQRYGHGSMNVRDAIRYSCDVYFYELGLKLGIERIGDYSYRLGCGTTLGIDLPQERAGLIPDPKWKKQVKSEPWYPGDTVNSSIGQGFVMTTPLQIACCYAVLANGGTLYRPHVLRRVVDYMGRTVLENSSGEIIHKVAISNADWRTLMDAFSSVVNDNGTGRRTKLPHVEICGKTGTAQAGTTREPHAWFVGFAPRENPSVVAVVFVEHGGHGGEQAAPIVKDLFLKLFPKPGKQSLTEVTEDAGRSEHRAL